MWAIFVGRTAHGDFDPVRTESQHVHPATALCWCAFPFDQHLMGLITNHCAPGDIEQPWVRGHGKSLGLPIADVSTIELSCLTIPFHCLVIAHLEPSRSFTGVEADLLSAHPECLHHNDFRVHDEPRLVTIPTKADLAFSLIPCFRKDD